MNIDLAEEVASALEISPSVDTFIQPPLSYKMLDPFDHLYTAQYPEPGLECEDLGEANDMEMWFNPNDPNSGASRVNWDKLGMPECSLLFSVDLEETSLAPLPRDESPLIDVHAVPQELHCVLSCTTFEYNPVMRSLIFNIGMGMPLSPHGFEFWVQAVNKMLSNNLPIIDVLISVDASAVSIKAGEQTDEAFLAVFWIINLLRHRNANMQGLSLNLPPHLPVSQTALNVVSTRSIIPNTGSSGSDGLDDFNLSTLLYSGSLSLLNTLIPASSMRGLQVLVVNDPQVSLDDVVILLKQAPQLCSLELGTLTDCYPTLLPVYQTVCSRSVSPVPAFEWDRNDGDVTPSNMLTASNVVHNKKTNYPNLETLTLKYDVSVCPVKLFENFRMSGLKSRDFVPVGRS